MSPKSPSFLVQLPWEDQTLPCLPSSAPLQVSFSRILAQQGSFSSCFGVQSIARSAFASSTCVASESRRSSSKLAWFSLVLSYQAPLWFFLLFQDDLWLQFPHFAPSRRVVWPSKLPFCDFKGPFAFQREPFVRPWDSFQSSTYFVLYQ